MKVVLTQPVEIALRSLGDEERRRVSAWFDHLENWDNDPFVREHSHKLGSAEGVYVLRTSLNYLIFFTFEQDRIVVLDIATKDTISKFRQAAESGQT
jgi:hypothetical protein